MANDQIQKLTGYQFNRATQFDSKIGKPVVHESLTVKAKPKLREFQGVDLLGSFAIDNEGVVPADEEVVISGGVLKALLNNRTLTTPSQRANGFSNGPGVIEVTSTMRDTEKQLKDKLLAQAKAAGLDYAIIIRDGSLMGTGFMKVYKIYVDDGREEPVREVYIEAVEMRTLRKVAGASEKYSAYNVSLNPMGGGDPTAVVSVIVPDQILIEELDIKPMSLPLFHEVEYVPNPLAVE
jgi:predicted Zn-dependent protease